MLSTFMTPSSLTQNLIDYGLNNREASIYLYLLSNKDQTVFQVSKDLHLPRTTVYSDLERLKDRDLVGIFKKNQVAYWYAEHPRRLVKEAESKSSMIKEIFPELESMMQKNTLYPEVRFYEGKDAIKDIIGEFYDVFETRVNRNLYTISHPELLDNFPKYLPSALERKNRLKIFTHLLAPAFTKELNLPAYTNDEFREVRFIPDQFKFNSTIMVMEGRVALFSLKDGNVYAVTISSDTLSETFKQIFLFVWNMCVQSNKV